MQHEFPNVGAFRQHDNKTSFVVWAPLKNSVEVEVKGKFIALQKSESGYWSTDVDGVGFGERYRFRLDGGSVFPDPASCHQPEGVHGPSAVVQRDFNWTDQEWEGLSLGEMIQYELHVGTFTQEGNFDGVIGRLPYLKELGINAIELMPLAQFPGNRNWGYDGVYPFAVQNSYGGPEGLKKLVNEAHKHGIAVILDVVYNHQGPEGNYLSAFAPYFTEKYKTGWGSAINFDDAHCDGVRNFYWQNALMWLDEFHIDGLRLDAVHAIWDYSAKPFIEELRTRVKDLEKRLAKKKILIAEFDLNNPRYINPPAKGGYGLDGQWVDEYHHALHSLLTGEVDGYYEDFGEAEHLVRSLRDSYVYTGQYSVHRKKLFGVKPENNYDQFVVFSQNHDQVGNRLAGDRLSTQLSLEALKLAAAAVILSPHVPMIFMGEEFGETNPFQYFISHTDKELIEAVRQGRKKEFSYFNWKEEVPDPQSEDTFNACKLSWNFDDQNRSALLRFYRHIIGLRKSLKAFHNTERNSVTILPSSDKNVIIYRKEGEGQSLIVLMNFSVSNITIPPFSQTQQLILDTAATQWNGPASTEQQTNAMILYPQSFQLIDIKK